MPGSDQAGAEEREPIGHMRAAGFVREDEILFGRRDHIEKRKIQRGERERNIKRRALL